MYYTLYTTHCIKVWKYDFFVCILEKLELEGCLQAYVHNATKYDDCELANFPHVKTSLTCHWVCAGREPHNHHAVRRCAPDKMPVLPDKQVGACTTLL